MDAVPGCLARLDAAVVLMPMQRPVRSIEPENRDDLRERRDQSVGLHRPSAMAAGVECRASECAPPPDLDEQQHGGDAC
jgi:hypothetical protein